MTLFQQTIANWLETASAKLSNGGVAAADLAQLRQLLHSATPRQRLLYLQTRAPSIDAAVIGMAQHEPVAGQKDTLRTRTDLSSLYRVSRRRARQAGREAAAASRVDRPARLE